MSPNDLAKKLLEPRYRQVSKCVTGPAEGKWRVEFRHVEYLTDEEFAALRQSRLP